MRGFSHWRFGILGLFVCLVGCGGGGCSGCSGAAPKDGGAQVVAGSTTSGASDTAGTDPDATAEERRFIVAAKPFVAAIVAQKHQDAYALLSSHAKARMSRNQFLPEADDGAFEANEASPVTDVSAERFAELLKLVEKEHGRPREMDNLHVHSLDPKILSGTATGEDRIDALFAIGNMPQSIPAGIRKASLRVRILTQLSDAQFAEVAKEMEITVDELKKDEDFKPYVTLKVVLVEEGGLKVGYFEFLPPSMMD